MSTLPRDDDGHPVHPSGARRPLADVVPFPLDRLPAARAIGTHGLHLHRDDAAVDLPRPDGALMCEVLDVWLSLATDARSTLTEAQQAEAVALVAELRLEAVLDVQLEDPDVRARDLRGRSATACLRILLARALFVDEHTA